MNASHHLRALFVLLSAVFLFNPQRLTAAENFPANQLITDEDASLMDGGEEELEEFPTSAHVEMAGTGAPACNCPECQKKAAAADLKKKQAALKKAVATAYKPLFYDNNFAYINNPLYNDWYPGDHFKQIPLPWGCDSMLDIGGQYRARYHSENNIRGFGLTGNSDDFLLHRTRIFANAKIGDRFRAYVEYIDAESNYENSPPRAIEVNRSDLLNAFIDYKFIDDCCGGTLTGRVGRQELLYGSERLISPLDWANTRRTFDGLKFMWKDDCWNLDVFYTVLREQPLFVSDDERRAVGQRDDAELQLGNFRCLARNGTGRNGTGLDRRCCRRRGGAFATGESCSRNSAQRSGEERSTGLNGVCQNEV